MKESSLKTPFYVVDEDKLINNLRILKRVQDESGAKILLAQKAFSMYRVYPLISQYLSGATASGLYEARLAHEYMNGENHVFEPAFDEDEFDEICRICDHIVFNSLTQLEHHRKRWERAKVEKGVHVGIRINPEYSTQDGHEIYDPCASTSRLGIRYDILQGKLPDGVDGLHFHTLCEQNFEPLLRTFREFEKWFGDLLEDERITWINLGGGHHITRDDYDVNGLIALIKEIKFKYNVEVYLEPGEAIALDAGRLVTKVMDIVQASDMPVAILDTSAACHMPDVLEMPYRPPLYYSGEPKEKAYTYRLASRTCLAGDVIGEYSFDSPLEIGDRLMFGDMAIYSMVKNNTFNGMKLPDICYRRLDGDVEVVREFGYQDFKARLS